MDGAKPKERDVMSVTEPLKFPYRMSLCFKLVHLSGTDPLFGWIDEKLL